ncbi:MAG: M20/M25/M40 family metallo-hydrolase [Candidatus Bipolaricaulis sp.]|nr:M20/M25/M40 family metallo-hydrolase [Candidatus Bipolaricaulis sp.]
MHPSMAPSRLPSRPAPAARWIALAVLLVFAAAPLVPPPLRDGTSLEDFSAARAFEHIERIAREPRPIGTRGNERARAAIVEQLRLLGLEPELQAQRVRDYYGRSGGSVDVVNVLARIPGTAPTKAVALMGHYDTVPGAPGANDDASAVAAMLETGRALLAGPPLRSDVILLFTDGEEPAPRFGSSAFVAEHPWAAGIGFLINLEALGSGGPSLLVEVSAPQGWVVEQYAAAVAYPAAFSFVTTTAELVGGSNSDFATFRNRGVPGIELAYLHGSPIYHTSTDAPERVSLRSLQQQGANMLALVRHVGRLDLDALHDDSASVFFSVAGLFVVRYSAAWALPLALLAGVALAVVGWRERAWLRILQSSGATLVTTALAAAAALGIWIALAGWRHSMGLIESYVFLAFFLALAVTVAVAVARLARRGIPVGADALGVLLAWWGLGLFSAACAPGMSYLFTWPAVAGGLVLVIRPVLGSKPGLHFVGWALAAGVAVVLLVPAVDIFYQLAQPRPGNPDSQALPFVAVPVVLLTLVVEFLRSFWVRRSEPDSRTIEEQKPA